MSAYANITSCISLDASQGRADALDMTLSDAAQWYAWKPQMGDAIEVREGAYTTGRLYLSALVPEGDSFRVIATSLPREAFRRKWAAYSQVTLNTILQGCAAECGMDSETYGVEGGALYSYLIRRNEGCAAFLNRLAKWEGLALKAFDGAFRLVSIEWAQERKAARKMKILAQEDSAAYYSRPNARHSSLTVETPFCKVIARDENTAFHDPVVVCDLPARDAVTAGRWARGLLLDMNRKHEKLEMTTAFDPRLIALNRIDVTGDTAANGQWLIEEAEHDLFNGRSSVTMYRVYEGIM